MENSSSTDAANPSDCLCQNGGVCVDLNGTCECPRGFTGLYCQFEVTQTPCSNSRPCPDGGPCLEYGGTYLCTCQTGVDFDRKDFYPYVQPQSACDSSPCQNGGYCYEKDGGYNCECKHGYRGKRCEIVRLSFCASSPCRYGGSCEEEGDSYRCLCPHRFTGKYCEVGRPDPCASSPCLNGGTCFHYIGKYKCLDCGSPVKIKHAEVQYSSTTLGSIASYTCHPGYTALPRATQSTCSSQGFWSQPPVCEEINECLSQPCMNGATCQDRIAFYLCECEDGFTGQHCQTDIDECVSEPCKHGATCEDQPGSYFCHCQKGYAGQDCEIEQDGCKPNPCLNGGVCRGYGRNHLCVCKEGYVGDRCQTLDNPCVLQPCGNRGICSSHKRDNYSCACRVGHTGRDCERDLLPPSGLHVLRVEEKEVELRWDQSDATQNLISGFAIVFAPVGRLPRRTDFLEKQHSTYVLQGLNPGQLYNISAFSVKRNTNSNDISQPAFALIRTRPRKVEQLEVVNVSSSQVWLRWLVLVNRHTAVSQVRVSLVPADGGRPRTAILNSNVSEYTFSTLLPGQMYTIDVVTQSGLRPEDLPSTSKSAGPLHFWTRPLPPQNLSLSSITATSARVTWDHHPQSLPDGFVVNITQGLTTRSRYLPDGSLGTYTLRDLAPGQHCHLALTSVHKTGKDKIESVPQHLAFTTLPILKDQSRGDRLQGGQNYRVGQIWTQVKDGGTVDNTEPFEDPLRYTEFIDGRGRITAKFTSLPHKTIRHRTKPDPPIRLEKLDKTTNKISLALEIPEEVTKNKSESSQDCRAQTCQNGGTCVQMNELYSCNCATDFKGRWCELYCQRWSHPCTRLYSETKSVPVWEDGVCHYLYKRTYKVQQDVCFREICEPLLPTKTPTIDMYLPSTPSGIFL
ncbi:sushi, nidogen and EGF-like domain-containing protein 1 isoform X5 [Triplophysa rosa]|uniref:sushi, nidogen and EGF-like domain-containing protein 1 isoform X5 n=1 Tax=Triplophysa rosa TaxID=992332 RepID=UPI002545E0E5|nr:sushi, nidogen and EGF-like domain-containing protein 1 isoform X5 [Triplophysa rosa]